MPILAGILAWFAYPNWSQGYFAWIALVPLILYVMKVRGLGAAFLGGLLSGAVQFLGLLYWIPRVLTQYGGVPVLGSWGLFLPMLALLGCFTGLACSVTHYCIRRGGAPFMLVFAPVWVSLEYLRSRVPFGGFPWLNVGYSQTEYLRIIQIADLVGVYGVSFLIVWTNAALVLLLAGPKRGLRSVTPLLLGAGMLLFSLIYGDRSLEKWDPLPTQYRVALLQGNLSIDESDATLMWKYQDGYVAMADRLVAKKIDLLILPEAPSLLIYQYDAHYRETMQSLARRFRLGMFFNNIEYREIGGQNRYFNTAFFLDRNGTEVGRYDKIHLVPFGEYIPWHKVFFFSETISKDVADFSPGNTYSTFPVSGHIANTVICFEAVFPDLVREFVRRGKSELIINLTNDAWYGKTSAPYQHLAMARWRAVENRRYLLRAANSGISAIISPSGRIREQTGLLCQDIAVGDFTFLSGTTFYTNHGGLPIFLCAIISFLAVAWNWMRTPRANGSRC